LDTGKGLNFRAIFDVKSVKIVHALVLEIYIMKVRISTNSKNPSKLKIQLTTLIFYKSHINLKYSSIDSKFQGDGNNLVHNVDILDQTPQKINVQIKGAEQLFPMESKCIWSFYLLVLRTSIFAFFDDLPI
jgi:hypothetical protein